MFLKGADISSVSRVESGGSVFTENGQTIDPFIILRNHGINTIRLRLWHSPENGFNNLAETALLAQRAINAGMSFILDLHYSDTWADPGHQSKPALWEDIPYLALRDSVYAYTASVLSELERLHVTPDIVQIGNEITCGMLWDDGRVCGSFDTDAQWQKLRELITEGVRAVREHTDPQDSVSVMVHIDQGGDNEGSRWFFDHLENVLDDIDMIGLSFYPWWQGTLHELESNLTDLSQRYARDIVVVEAAYPWTLAWYDTTHNIIGEENQLHEGYPASVNGQTAYLVDILSLIRAVPEGRGRGLVYWAPEWIPAQTFGSPWENLALFDFQGETLASLNAFDSVNVSVLPEAAVSHFSLDQNYPNPFNPTTTIRFQLEVASHVTLTIYDILGREIAVLVSGDIAAGRYERVWDATGFPGGVYIYRIRAGAFAESKGMMMLK
jgi:arabinogalactan endo-1,4-beta-galactosidase